MKLLGAAVILMVFSVAGTATAVAQEVPRAAYDLPRGKEIEVADIANYDEDAKSIVGWVTRRVITEGAPLEKPSIAAPDVIRSGDPVQLVWREGSLELRIRGKAMGSAAEGEDVLVRVDSKRRYQGIARAPGVVHLENETR